MQSYKCDKCGAELILNNEIQFTKCLFCGNSIAIIKDNEIRLNIKEIIPFSIEKEDAIKYFKKYYGEEVIDAKKVYVPVRFCDYDFEYLINYNYYVITTDSDGNKTKTYYDNEDLIDGYVENDILFGETRVNRILFEGLFDEIKDDRVKFDYALLKDVSIEYSQFNEKKEVNIKDKLTKKIRDFSFFEIFNKLKKGTIDKIYSENYFINDIEIEDFSTLIPVYIVRSKNGIIYNMPGVQKIYEKVTEKRKKNLIMETAKRSSIFAFFLSIPYLIFLKTVFYNSKIHYIKDEELRSRVIIASIIALLVLLFAIIVIYYSVKKKSGKTISKISDNNYKYEKHVISHESVF